MADMSNPLKAWLKANSTTHEAFAERVGRDRSTVTRWSRRRPRTVEAMKLIERATDGAVPAASWLNLADDEATA